MREWLGAFAWAPLGTVVGVALWAALTFDQAPVVSRGRVGGIAFASVALAVALSYVVGLLLLPVYLAMEASRWRGWKVYVPVGTIAGLSVAWALQHWSGVLSGWGGRESQSLALLALGALCGALNAVVFSFRIR